MIGEHARNTARLLGGCKARSFQVKRRSPGRRRVGKCSRLRGKNEVVHESGNLLEGVEGWVKMLLEVDSVRWPVREGME